MRYFPSNFLVINLSLILISLLLSSTLAQPQTDAEIKAQLAEQNALGERFFGMDSQGYPVADRLEDVLDLKITMAEEDYNYMMVNRTFELYRPFTNARVLSQDGEVLLEHGNSSPGRIRPRGSQSLHISSCLEMDTIPFLLDFNRLDPTQTLFGAGRVYLRMHVLDPSYTRDWAIHRMLARFGLPHLRTRTVRFYINGNLMGLYDLMEAIDQEYVLSRSFPDYNPQNYTAYKVKSHSMNCGRYDEYLLEAIKPLVNDTSTGPYSFQRGEHPQNDPQSSQNSVISLSGELAGVCVESFWDDMAAEFNDTMLAYLRHGEDCGETLLEEGIIDRHLGDASMDPTMKSFINKFLAHNSTPCQEEGCVDKYDAVAAHLDIDNVLKTTAFYAAVMEMDSPLGNGKGSYYLAQTGDDKGWKILPFDFDTTLHGRAAQLCHPDCQHDFVHWAIVQPTCQSLYDTPLVGPLLLNEELHEQYMEYLEEFVATVLTNETFIQEIQDHIAAIEPFVQEDVYAQVHREAFAHNYTTEFTPNAELWDTYGYPFLPTLAARSQDILDQLQALEDGSYPRGPHHEIVLIGREEQCVDWRYEQRESNCYNDCRYKGCYESTWEIPGVCSQAEGICYHGQFDPQCSEVRKRQMYDIKKPVGAGSMFCYEDFLMTSCNITDENATTTTEGGEEETGGGQEVIEEEDENQEREAVTDNSESSSGNRIILERTTTRLGVWIVVLSLFFI